MRSLLLLITSTLLFTGCASTRDAVPTGGSEPPAAQPPDAGVEPASGLDPELTNYEYPLPTRDFRFESQRQQLRMTYIDEQPANWNGRTVLLLHGKNFSGAYWEPTVRALLEKGFRVVAPDQIGFGKSSKPERYQFSFSQLAHNTASLLDSLQIEKVDVVGHSMGGMLATRFALDYPKRTGKFVLVNPIGLEDYRRLAGYRPIDALYQDELKATPESIRQYQQQVYYAGQWKPEYDRYVEILAGWTQHPEYPRVAWNAALTTEMVLTQPVVSEFPQLKAPTLLIIGQRDRTALGRNWAPKEIAPTMGNYPELGRKTARAIPGARLVELPGLGHMPQVENFPAYFTPLSEFLTGP